MMELRALMLFVTLMFSGTAGADSISFENQKAPDKSDLAASVNGIAIREADIDVMIQQITPSLLFHKDVPPERREKLRKDAIEKSVDSELLSQEAARIGIKISEDDVGKALKERRARFRSSDEFAEALKKKGLTEDALGEKIRKTLRINGLLKRKVDEAAAVSDTELKDHYAAEKARFMMPEKVRLSEIFIYIAEDADDELKAKRTRTAEEALDRTRAGGDFCELASKYSEDDLKTKCGDTGYIHRMSLDETLQKEMGDMKEGDVKMIGIEKGLMIVKLMKRIPQRQLSFDEVKERLRKELISSRQKETIEKLIADLRTRAKIEIYNK
jgi:parvulin-like peptidyl-prolyl isomerase